MGWLARGLSHPDVPGAGAAKRRGLRLSPAKKRKLVMAEFERGTLHSGGSGKVVTNPKQAWAIAKSEERRAAARRRG